MSDLVRRRRPLARRASAGDDHDRDEYLSFVLEQDAFVVRVSYVHEILRLPPLTPVPRAPSWVRGIVSVRGQLVTVMDLRTRMGLPAAPPTKRTRILLVSDVTAPSEQREIVGLLVDEVQHVYRLRADEIEPSSVLGSEGGATRLVVGIARPDLYERAPGEQAAHRRGAWQGPGEPSRAPSRGAALDRDRSLSEGSGEPRVMLRVLEPSLLLAW